MNTLSLHVLSQRSSRHPFDKAFTGDYEVHNLEFLKSNVSDLSKGTSEPVPATGFSRTAGGGVSRDSRPFHSGANHCSGVTTKNLEVFQGGELWAMAMIRNG